MSVINIKYKLKVNTFDFIINITDGDETVYNYKGIALEPFEYGNDDDIDTVIYPESVSLEFTVLPGTGTAAQLDNRYYQLSRSLALDETAVTINKNGAEYLKGFIESKTVGNNWSRKSIIITVLSNFHKLKDIDPRTLNPADYTTPVDVFVSPGNQVLYTDLILKLIQIVYPSCNQVVIISGIESQTTITILGEPWMANAQYFGDFNYVYIGEHSTYTRAIDVIKEICSNLGCVGILKDKKFVIQSRFYFSQTVVTIPKNQFIDKSGPEIQSSKKLDGLQVLVRYATLGTYSREAFYGEVLKDGDGNLVHPERVEVFKTSGVGGYPPGGFGEPLTWRNIWIYVPGFVAGLGNSQFTASVANSFFIGAGAHQPLWKTVADKLWELISNDRFIMLTKVKGLDWAYNNYYQFVSGSNKFRARKLYYDENTASTKMELLEG